MIILTSFKDDFNKFLLDNALYLCLGVVALILICLFILFLINRKKGAKKKPLGSNDEWLTALGGKENIIEANAVGSRLSLKLQNADLLNKDKLKELGVTSIMSMAGKVTLVIEGLADEIKRNLGI